MNKQQIISNLSETEQAVILFNSNYNHNEESKILSDNFIREINILKKNVSRFTEEYILNESVQSKLINITNNMRLMSEMITKMYKQTNNV